MEAIAVGQPMFGNVGLLQIGDGVATTREIAPNKWEPATFVGYVTAKSRNLHNGTALATLDSGEWVFAYTKTLAIWKAS